MSQIVTGHQDIIHDTQFNYYGQLIATASSDRTVKIFSVGPNKENTLIANLCGHEGPVWMVAWAHPRFGNSLASCSYDTRAIVWKEQGGLYKPAHIIDAHSSSVNAIVWAPHEYGIMLVTASSDGSVGVTSSVDGVWRNTIKIGKDGVAHPMGSMGTSMAPYHPSTGPLIASAGCDGLVKLWAMDPQNGWTSLSNFSEHKDWVRDVAFNPASNEYIILASCSQDKKIIIRRKKRSDISSPGGWEVSVTTLAKGAWRLSWSLCGTMLLVTTQDSEAILLKEGLSFTDQWITSPLNDQQQ